MHHRTPGSRSRAASHLAVILLGAFPGVLLTGCVEQPVTDSVGESSRPDIFLITVDTLRADRLSSYGYGLPTSPFIDSLAAEGVRFERAYSTSSWTLPSVVSMLTSTYPRRHGMGERDEAGEGQWHVLPSDLPSLPESLKAAGYRTFGFSANFALPAERGFSRGFDRYRCVGAVDTDGIHAELVRWIPDLEADGPWFFWLHLFDPHAPYTAREPWLSELYPTATGTDAASAEVAAALMSLPDRTPEVMDRATRFYDSEVRHLDNYLRELFALVPRTRDALVVLAADHGEEFLDHGDVLHGRNLYDETARVPFIVRFPDRKFAGRVVAEPASLVDVLPTLLGAAGVSTPAGVVGVDLAQRLGDGSTAKPRWVFAELEKAGRQRAVSDGRWKFIAIDEEGMSPQLFDLVEDPGERTNVAASRPELEAQFRRQLAEYARDHAAPAAPLSETEITDEQAEALKTLGYIQ